MIYFKSLIGGREKRIVLQPLGYGCALSLFLFFAACVSTVICIHYFHENLTGILLLVDFQILVSAWLVFLTYKLKRRNFTFSSGFWLVVNILLYIVVKSFYLENDELLVFFRFYPYIILFFLAFVGGLSFTMPSRTRLFIPLPELYPTKRKLLRLILIFFIIKLLSYILRRIFAGSADTTLEVVAQTQNQGMSYLFNISLIGNFVFYMILYVAYAYRKWQKAAVLMSVIFVIDCILSASRTQIVIFLLANCFFYDKYIQKIKFVYLLILTPVIIFIISFFGMVRNIEIGDMHTYLSVFSDFSDDTGLILDLFIKRLDMLPVMLNAYSDLQAGHIKHLYGLSYLYMFLHAIPRNIWPGKPMLSAALITSEVSPDLFSAGINLYCSVIIEAMMNFGLFGVVLSGFVIGRLGRMFDRFKDSRNGYKVLVYIVFFTFPMGLFNEGFHSNYISVMLYQLFLIGVTILLVNLRYTTDGKS